METLLAKFVGPYIIISQPELYALCQERNNILFFLNPESPSFEDDLSRLYEINAYLKCGRIQNFEERCDTTVGFGSIITVCNPITGIESDYIFTEKAIVSKDYFNCLDMETSNCYGRGIGDIIELPSIESEQYGCIDMVGKISNVKFNERSIVIRENKSHRVSRKAGEAITEMNKNNKYKQFIILTSFQNMLMNNAYYFYSTQSYDASSVRKLNHIIAKDKIKVYDALPEGDSIGFGSLVLLQFVDSNGKSKQIVAEYVVRAFSYEPLDSVIEWTSSLGYNLFGQKAGFKTRYWTREERYNVTVLGVNNTYRNYVSDPTFSDDENSKKAIRKR